MTRLPLLFACLSAASWAAGPPPPAAPPRPPPSDAECKALPPLKTPFSFGPGELLEFDLDAMGAQAGKMTMRVLPSKDGALPVEVHAQTNSFFSKVRRVNGLATSYLGLRTLRPSRYVEDTTENEIHKTADVAFLSKERKVTIGYTIGAASGRLEQRYGNEGLDVAGAVYLMRQLPLRQELAICFDVYGIRRLWRLTGKVVGREHVSIKLGEYDAWHLAGEAVRLDDHRMRREVHVWISDDAQRLPLAAVGSIDLGAVRATLTGHTRGGKASRAQGKETLKW